MTKSLFAVFLFVVALAACTPNNITEDSSLGKFFTDNNATGTFGIFDNGKGEFTIYNVGRFSDSVYAPASTFQVVSSLVGIETRQVNDTSSVIAVDSINTSMNKAFRESFTPWHQQLVHRIGKDTLQFWLDTLGYASRYQPFKIQDNLDRFWLDNSAKVSADEQMGLVKRLYFDQLPFTKRAQREVRSMMLQESNANYQLSYVTGAVWTIGWIEENKHVYFFVLQAERGQSESLPKPVSEKILRDILQKLGFFEGKK